MKMAILKTNSLLKEVSSLLFPKINPRRIWFSGAMVLVAGLLGYAGYALMVKPPAIDYRLKQSELVQQDAKVKITDETMILQTIVYLKCGDEESLSTKATANYVGLTLPQFQSAYPGWIIDHFDTEQVKMVLRVDTFCRTHANSMYIGAKDGFVTVFYGRPGLKPIVKEVTAIPVSHLVAEDIAELEKGIVIQTKEELLRTLEGMQSQ